MVSIGLISLFLLLSGFDAFAPSLRRQPHSSFRIATQLHSASGNFKGSFSFVEGSDFFASQEEEIDAMGGDPSFLVGNDNGISAPKEEEQGSKESPDINTPAKFEWDGEVIEDAYFDD